MRSLIFLLLLSFNATAALYDRGNGLIYDDVLDITWLQDANYAQTSGYDSDGMMNWNDANEWANNLVYAGHDNWRLPSMGPNLVWGENQTGSELGFMYYENLSNTFTGVCDLPNYYHGSVSCIKNISFIDSSAHSANALSFDNLIYQYPDGKYWFGEENPIHPNWGMRFQFTDGLTDASTSKSSKLSAWPVHDGDIGLAPVPLPAGIYLFLSGLVGLVGVKLRGRNA